MIDLSKIKQSQKNMLITIAVIIGIVVAVLLLMPKSKTVTLQIQVVDNYGQPVVNKSIVIENLEKDPLIKDTDNEGFVTIPAKITQKEKQFIIKVSTRDFSQYTQEFILLKEPSFQSIKVRLGIETVRLRVSVIPNNVRYKLFDYSTGDKVYEGLGTGQVDIPPNSTYKLNVFDPNKKYDDKDTTIIVGEQNIQIRLELLQKEQIEQQPEEEEGSAIEDERVVKDPVKIVMVDLKININPSTGSWKLQDARTGRLIQEGQGDKTIKVEKGRKYAIIGRSTERGYTHIKSEKSVVGGEHKEVLLPVMPKSNKGTINISVTPENVSWEILYLANKKMYKKGKGSKSIEQIPLEKYQIKFKYEGATKQSETIVLTPIKFRHSSLISFIGLDDKIAKCIDNKNYECATDEYEECLESNCKIPCGVYDKIANAYYQQDLDGEGLEVFKKGYLSSLSDQCNLNNNSDYLYKYLSSLNSHSTNYDDIEKIGEIVLGLAKAETKYAMEGAILTIRYINTYKLLDEKLSSSPNNDEICSLFNRCEEDIQRMNNLRNIHGVTLKDLSTWKSAIKSLKIKASQCI